ncbi:hypothetical protein ACFS6H_12195 [Terrimonas rubra]|uniref:Outer membrane protein beta-barrel domain-containing protein n=1 Tax=Terrimonas rubra TaxID=1035890 RepID=A0ABW6A8H5_9BACT
MKLSYLLTFTLAFLTISVVSFSQVQFGVHGSRLEGTGSSQWGFGGHAKVLLADKVAIGLGVRAYPKDMKTENTTIGGTNYKIARGNTIVPVTGSVDYYFGEGLLRPYVGADVGAYFTQYVFSMTENNGSSSYYDTKDKKTYFGAAPKVGLNVELGPVGIFGQAGYNLLFGSGDKDDIMVPGITTGIDAKATDKFWTFDVGVFLKLGGKK